MKTKLLSTILLVSAIASAQNPIASYYSEDNVAYLLGTSATPIDQSASGANINWNFTLDMAGASIHSIGTVSGAELASYPGSTHEENIVWTPLAGLPTESSIYSKNPSGVVSLTAFKNASIELNCITNNATFGTFPLNYGYTNTDPIAGTYSYDTYNGTFTGNAVTTVDAYGTLNVNIGNVPAGSTVTRLKTVMNISLFYSPFPTSVGTASQTTYSYYGTGMNAPLMRTTNTTFNVPLLSVNENSTDIEVFDNMLATQTFSASSRLQVQNPVGDWLNIKATDVQVQAVSITDINGKVVFQSKMDQDGLNVSQLNKGFYMLSITTERGTHTQKIIKK